MRSVIARVLTIAILIGLLQPAAAATSRYLPIPEGSSESVDASATYIQPTPPKDWTWSDLGTDMHTVVPQDGCNPNGIGVTCEGGDPPPPPPPPHRPDPCPSDAGTNCTTPPPDSGCPRNNGYAFIFDGHCLTIEDTVVLYNDRLLVPMRSALNAVGGDQVAITWFAEWETPCARTVSTMVCFPINEHTINHDGELIPVNQGAVVYPAEEQRTKVPLRFLFERFGIGVEYITGSKTVVLRPPDDPFGPKNIDQMCSLHGYGGADTCPVDKFVVPLAYAAFGWYNEDLMPGLVSTAHLWWDESLSDRVIRGINYVGMDAYRAHRVPRLSVENGQIAATAGYVGLGIAIGTVGALFAYEVIVASSDSPWVVEHLDDIAEREMAAANAVDDFTVEMKYYHSFSSVDYFIRNTGRSMVQAVPYQNGWKVPEVMLQGRWFDNIVIDAQNRLWLIETKAMPSLEKWLRRESGRFLVENVLDGDLSQMVGQLQAAQRAQQVYPYLQVQRLQWIVDSQTYADFLKQNVPENIWRNMVDFIVRP